MPSLGWREILKANHRLYSFGVPCEMSQQIFFGAYVPSSKQPSEASSREDDLAAGRQSMNELLEQDWMMPRAVSEVSIHWRRIEDSLRTNPEGQAGVQSPTEELQAAWTAYREIEDVLQAPE